MKYSTRLLPVLALLSGLPSQAARASGPVEMLVGVYVDPDAPQRLIVRYDNTGSKTGLLYSEDGGDTFSLVCTTSIAAAVLRDMGSPSQDTKDRLRSSLSRSRMARVTGGGRTLVGTTAGLYIDNGAGCDFQDVSQVSGLWISGLAATADDPRVSYVITNGSTTGAGEGLWQRDAAGTFTQLSGRNTPPDGQVYTNSGLLAAKRAAGGTRFYTASLRYASNGMGFHTVLTRSDDGGAHWDEYEVMGIPAAASFSLLAVDPLDENHVVAMFERSNEGGDLESNKDTVIVSSDGGETWQPYFDATRVSGTLFEADGTLWVSDLGPENGGNWPTGLYKAAPGLKSAPEHLLTDQNISCLGKAPSGDQLLLCRRVDFGTYDRASDTFTALTEMTQVESIRSCSGQDLVADCHDQLCEPGWCGPGHFSKAPLCSAYNERYCGNNADNYNDPVDAGAGVDAGGDGDGGSGDGDSSKDAGVPSDLGPEGHVVPRPKDDCSVHPSGSTRAPSWAALLTLLTGALFGARRGRTRGAARGHRA